MAAVDEPAVETNRKTEDVPESKDKDASDHGGQEDANSKKPAARKRTKTGCLTCRKRRIKCDEGRPICNNCTKSKRHCEGYNQRVIFKDPLGAFHGGTYGPVVFPPEPSPRSFFAPGPSQAQPSSSHIPPLAAIAPKPPPGADFHNFSPPGFAPHQFANQTNPTTAAPDFYAFDQVPYGQRPLPTEAHSTSAVPPFPHGQQQSPSYYQQPGTRPPGTINENTHHQLANAGAYHHLHPHQHPPPTEAEFAAPPVHGTAPFHGRRDVSDGQLGQTYLEDDASMVEESDDELDYMDQENTYGGLVQSHGDGPLEGLGTRIRTFSAFADHDILTSYIPQATNSPLNDSKTASLFWHFVNVTGPSMSIYERHPLDLDERVAASLPAPNAQHNIWTYTFPIMAFNHPALLQAMLALGSLQIAKLNNQPATAALKHYHLAIRRIARHVRSNLRRTQPSTIASIMLLAFFEVWNSDHTKWCQHLYGARLLFSEIPFRQMAIDLRPMKRARRQMYEEHMQSMGSFGLGQHHNHMLHHDVDDLDMNLLSQLSGQQVGFDGDLSTSAQFYTERDLERYEHLRDLFWWYTKMDVYQGLLSGGRPFMDNENRAKCPPRAPIGRLEAIYGTYDHLMLLMARLMTFAARDLPRKRKSAQMYGMMGGQEKQPQGGSRPEPKKPPGERASPPFPRPGEPSGQIPPGMSPGLGGPAGTSPPLFPGMLPTPKVKVQPPMGFSPPRDSSPPTEPKPEDIDLETATAEAMQEWESIRLAFETLRARFGPQFEPLGPEYADRRNSPFGPTLQYRTFSVAGIWLNYYMGIIHLYRTHPKMPPAAMIAQGIQARHTGQYANEIGRIAAGLCDDLTGVTEISTLVGAAIMECCLPLFVGGIQYQDDMQRHWVIRRLHDIARLTGWQSSRQIAEGCESGWRKAAQMGKGPPYTRDPALERDVPRSVWAEPRDRATQLEAAEGQGQVIVVGRTERASYAIGLLSVERDLDRLDLEGDS